MIQQPSGTTVFGVPADPTRRALLDLMSERERSVQDLAGNFDVTLSAIPRHLKVLRESGLVVERREGRACAFIHFIPRHWKKPPTG